MIKYREHRGSLEESLKTAKEFNTIKELFDFLILDTNTFGVYLKLENIQLSYYCYDERCQQELYMIHADGYGVFGFIYEEVAKDVV